LCLCGEFYYFSATVWIARENAANLLRNIALPCSQSAGCRLRHRRLWIVAGKRRRPRLILDSQVEQRTFRLGIWGLACETPAFCRLTE
jgi:hypothetical protein